MRTAVEAQLEVLVVPPAQKDMTAIVTITFHGGPHDGAKEMMANPPEQLRVPQFRTIRYNIDGEKRETNALIGWACYRMEFTKAEAHYIGFLQNQL